MRGQNRLRGVTRAYGGLLHRIMQRAFFRCGHCKVLICDLEIVLLRNRLTVAHPSADDVRREVFLQLSLARTAEILKQLWPRLKPGSFDVRQQGCPQVLLAMAKAFDRMLFLTATPFQLGHQELVRVLERFGDVKWDNTMPNDQESFLEELRTLNHNLTESQRIAILLQKCWTRLCPEELPSSGNANDWWESLQATPRDQLTPRQRALLDSYDNARMWRAEAESILQPWIIRHNKGDVWSGTQIVRRERMDGATTTNYKFVPTSPDYS